MKFKLINEDIKSDYGRTLLNSRGVQDIDAFLNPTEENALLDFKLLDNIKEGVNLLHQTLLDKKRILIIVDCDVDGYTSASIIYLYIKKIFPDAEIDYLLHEGKQHGLEDMMDSIQGQYGLVICPDASSNDYEYHEELKNIGTQVLVIDHHELEGEDKISDNAIIINNQLSKQYSNKDLTGAGLAYQFCRAFDHLYNYQHAKDFIDLAALGVIADMGSMLSLENRYFVKEGLKEINNFFFQILIEKQDYSMGGKVNPITVAFYIVPLINAMVRVGTMEEKERMFSAFVNGRVQVPSNKRGAKGTMELLAVESARECVNARSKQNRIKDKVVEQLEFKIQKLGLLDNKLLFVRLEEDDEFPAVLNGLVAMQLADRFKKPTIVARLNNQGYVRGSARGLNESELKDLKDFLNTTCLFEYTAGHPNAFGVSIKNDNLSKLHNIANEELCRYNFNENCYEVNFVRTAIDKDLEALILDLSYYSELWGQKNPEPLIAITEVNLNAEDVQIIGKNKDTVKFEKFGITYIKFKAKDLIEDLSEYPIMKLEIVGRPNLNEWMGQEKAQVMIEAYQIKDGSLEF